MKTVTIPFDLELAKKIQNGELSGKIVNGEGTEFEVVKWDSKGDYPLIGVYFDEETSASRGFAFTNEGKYMKEYKSRIDDLQLEVPEFLTIKENNTKFIFIFKLYKSDDKYQVKYHVMYNTNSKSLYRDDELMVNKGDNIYPSTPSEIVMLTEELRRIGKKWNPETKQVEDLKEEHVIKPLDLILVKSTYWELCQYAFVENGYVHTVGGLTFREWILYEGNEHLLGTIVTPKE